MDFWESGRREVEALEECGWLRRSSRVLDYGCGVGRLTLPLAERAAAVTGADVSGRALEELRRRIPRGRRVELTPVVPGEGVAGLWDLVVVVLVVKHMPPSVARATLTRLAESLAPGGRIVADVPVLEFEPGDARPRHWSEHADDDLWSGRFYWRREVDQLLLEPAGLEVETISGSVRDVPVFVLRRPAQAPAKRRGVSGVLRDALESSNGAARIQRRLEGLWRPASLRPTGTGGSEGSGRVDDWRPKTSPLVAGMKGHAKAYRRRLRSLHRAVRRDPDFVREGAVLYEFDTLENLEPIARLCRGRHARLLDDLPNRTMIDIGCANGDLGFVFEAAGFSVAMVDKAFLADAKPHNPPLVVSTIARLRGSRVAVVDQDIDSAFRAEPILEALERVKPSGSTARRFGVGVMVGVLYHMKNPYGVLERLTEICDHLILGTWTTDDLPGVGPVGHSQVAYLLRDRELAEDPTNYWVFTARSLDVLVERCGWTILSTCVLRQDGTRSSPPGNVNERRFLLLANARAER